MTTNQQLLEPPFSHSSFPSDHQIAQISPNDLTMNVGTDVAERSQEGATTKILKQATATPNQTTEETIQLVMEKFLMGKVGLLTIPQLKAFLRMKGLTLGGKKQDLVDRITDYLKG
eukprot:TRINITY_DN22758_c0_g1_i1.p1 TRINITY_DN22758_c0_g1~~TRINITY_DN22758_c0_g1_i1.p1  ORF type:complete len:116 (-),score=34.85 TRINITY_DN22758_c0_g1_i1:28-375(-)